MAETEAQTNNKAVKFKGRAIRKAHKRGLISDKEMAKAKQKETGNERPEHSPERGGS